MGPGSPPRSGDGDEPGVKRSDTPGAAPEMRCAPEGRGSAEKLRTNPPPLWGAGKYFGNHTGGIVAVLLNPRLISATALRWWGASPCGNISAHAAPRMERALENFPPHSPVASRENDTMRWEE